MKTATLIIPVENDLHLETQEGQIVVSSRYVAERFGKNHKEVLRAIENHISILGVAQNCAGLFIENQYQHPQNKQWYKEYLLTRDGFGFVAMGFTGEEAAIWKLEYIKAFNKMEHELKQSNPMEGISTELQAIIMQDKKLQVLDNRIGKLENEMTIDYGQKKELRDLGNKVAMTALGGKNTIAYRTFGRLAFNEIWKHYKNTLNINSYENTAVKDFERGKRILLTWTPSRELEYAIKGANMQGGGMEYENC